VVEGHGRVGPGPRRRRGVHLVGPGQARRDAAPTTCQPAGQSAR
jgi:hypothetical protein